MSKKSKKTTSTGGTRPLRRTYTHWLTRSTAPDTGELSNRVQIWTARPRRIPMGLGAVWAAEDPATHLYGEWSLEECVYHAKSYPDDDRQCIRVEGDSMRGPTDDVDRPMVS
jgi:hypothetical protein